MASGAERPVMPSVFSSPLFLWITLSAFFAHFVHVLQRCFVTSSGGGVANMQSSLDSVSLGRHPYPVRSFVNLREKGWKDGDGEGKIREKKPAVEKLNASVL